MKKAIGIIIAAVAFLGACASAPEPVPPPDDTYETAKTLRTQIQRFELAEYAQTEFNAGEEQFTTGETAYETEDYETAAAAFNLAIDSYTTVIHAGFRALAQTARTRATEQREAADAVRASVAVADAYAEALAVYNEALAAEEAGDDELAQELFNNAATLFELAFEQAAEKQLQALDALDRLEGRIEGLDVQREELERSTRDELEDEPEDETGDDSSTDEGGM